MSWVDKLIGLFKKEKKDSGVETKESSKPQEIKQIDTRPILKDSNGEDLICCLCENWDNETGDYYPIHEGEQKTYDAKKWHLNCFRAFMKEAKKGRLI